MIKILYCYDFTMILPSFPKGGYKKGKILFNCRGFIKANLFELIFFKTKCSCTVVCWGTYSISFINYLGVTDPHNQPCVKTICLPLSPFLLLCKSLYFLITIIICEYFISVIYHLRYAICIYLIYVFNFFLTHL